MKRARFNLVESVEILKRGFLYERKPYQYPTNSKLLFNFIEKLPKKQREDLNESLGELKLLRNKGI
jgi:hypothetical protein